MSHKAQKGVIVWNGVAVQGLTYAASDFKLSLGAPSQCKAILTPPPAGTTVLSQSLHLKNKVMMLF